MTDFKDLDDAFQVAEQITVEDFARAAEMGITTVINNRPDGESADQIPTAEAEALASAAGLSYHHIPIQSGQVTMEAVEAYAKVMRETDSPVLAYCRTGTRSCILWGLASALNDGLATEDIIARGAAAGYDLAPMASAMESLRD